MNRTQKIILAIVALILCAAVACAVVLIVNRTKFVPPESDAGAVDGVPSEDLSDFSYQELHVADGFDVALCANPRIDGKRLDLYFTNASDNRALMLVVVSDENGNELGRSGIMKPGQYVPSVELATSPQNDTCLKVKIITYEPDTYYSLGTASVKVYCNDGTPFPSAD